MRKITPTGGGIASMMNPPPQTRSPRSHPTPTPPPPPITSAGREERPMTRTPPSTRVQPLPLEAYRSPTATSMIPPEGGERRDASEMEMSAAEALSALAGMTPRGTEKEVRREVQGGREGLVSPRPGGDVSKEEEFLSPKSGGDVLKKEDVVSPESGVNVRKKSSADEEEVDEKASVDGVAKRADSAPTTMTPTPRKRKASAVAEDGQAPTNGKVKKRTVKEKPNGELGVSKPSAPSAEPTPQRTPYNPHRISEPRSILQPITRDELLYIRNPRNIRNPLKTFRPRIIVPQDEPYPDPPLETRSMEPVTEQPRAIERGGDKRGVQVRQLGRGRDGEEKRGREESVGREEERKRPKVEHGKGFQVADHCMSTGTCRNRLVADALADNKRGNQGVDNREKSTIIGLRSCNNWIKAVMIQTYIRRRPNLHWNGYSPNGRVLDMGCGKGGDIQKWDRANIGEYVGCGESRRGGVWDLAYRAADVAAGSIEDFRLRLRDRRRKYPVELFVLDCFRVRSDNFPRDCC